MSGNGANGEMGRAARLSDDQVERLLAGRVPTRGGGGLAEVAAAIRGIATVATVAAPVPDPDLIGRLAEAARSGAAAGSPGPAVRGRPAARPRGLWRLGQAAAAAGLAVLAIAGLAFAGVKLPDPVQSAFEKAGIQLPNQADGSSSAAHRDSPAPSSDSSNHGAAADGHGKGSGSTSPRKHRKAVGPSGAARTNPPGKAVRRGPNPSPGTPRGKPESTPGRGNSGGSGKGGSAKGQPGGSGRGGSGSKGNSGGSGRSKAVVGHSDGKGNNG